ncbi:MAG TPA: preprotein translocase subunit SecG [Chitinophagaceae bacterium]|nr:preprotein translocase subunit SecG [Chitinophagaceae bacterium]
MLIFFGILVLIASVLLAIFVLIQNPKGGGLSGTFGGVSNQTMGVRQTTDFLEKGTWGLIIFIAAVSLASSFFIGGNDATSNSNQESLLENNITLPSPATPNSPLSSPATQQKEIQAVPPQGANTQGTQSTGADAAKDSNN